MNVARYDQYEPELYLGGELAPPGDYQRIGFNWTVHLDQEDHLPASLDGHVAVYARVCFWREHLEIAEHEQSSGSGQALDASNRSRSGAASRSSQSSDRLTPGPDLRRRPATCAADAGA